MCFLASCLNLRISQSKYFSILFMVFFGHEVFVNQLYQPLFLFLYLYANLEISVHPYLFTDFMGRVSWVFWFAFPS